MKMRTIRQITLALLIAMHGGSALAQWQYNGSLDVANGFERNIFRNPETLIVPGDTLGRPDLWQNGMYQTLQSDNSIKRELKKGMLRLTANGGVGVYHTDVPANRYHYHLGASYRIRYSDGRFAEIAPSFDRVKRQGIDITDIELRTPFSYHKAALPVHLDFYKGRRVWIRTEGGVVGKLYDRELNERLQYVAPYLLGEVSKKWIAAHGAVKASLHSRAEWRRIDERTASINGSTGEFAYTDRLRHWHFYTIGIDVKYKSHNEKWRMEAGLHRMVRIERDQLLTYHHTAMNANVHYRLKKTGFGLASVYGVRNYPTLAPGRNNTTPLRYIYTRLALTTWYELNKQLSIHASYLLNNRDANNPTETMIGFRGYENMLLEAGLKMNF